MKKKILLGIFILGGTLLLSAYQNMPEAKKSMSVQEEVANHLTKIGLKKEGINAILGNFSDKVDTKKKSANFPNEFGWN